MNRGVCPKLYLKWRLWFQEELSRRKSLSL